VVGDARVWRDRTPVIAPLARVLVFPTPGGVASVRLACGDAVRSSSHRPALCDCEQHDRYCSQVGVKGLE
jgi:hypothetical protein